MTLVMGVDSSTQSCKVVITDAATGAIVREGRAAHPHGTEVIPEAGGRALRASIADAGGLGDVEAWAIGGQQHGMVVLDAEGRVIRDALLWNDTRSAGAAADLIAEFGAEALAQRTGLVPVASFTITKLRWLRDHEPENAARVAAVALPHDWLTWRLRGFGPEGESAARPGARRARHRPIGCLGHRLLGPRDRRLRPRPARRGARARRGPAARARTRRVGRRTRPDAASAAAPATTPVPRSGSEPGPATSSSRSARAARSSRSASSARSTRPGRSRASPTAPARFLPLVATLNAARVLDAIAGLLGVDHAELSRLALAAEPGARGLALVPYFEGERTPNLPDATASLTGMTLASTTRENLARAAVEGMLCGLGAGLEALRALGVPLERALLIGGGAQSEAVRVIAPLVLGVPVEVPAPGEYVALGAARQAASVLADLTSVRPRRRSAQCRTSSERRAPPAPRRRLTGTS